MSKSKVGTNLNERTRIITKFPFLEDKNLWDKIVIDEMNKKIVGEIESREIIFLCGIGRLVKNSAYSSFNLLIHSESSAGKDYTMKNVLKIFPDDYVFSRTRISPTVLNYWKPYKRLGQDTWNGCILYLPDIGDSILNSDALKLMCSDGSHITITDKGQAIDIEIKGKPVVFSTTANSTPNEEILNRFSIVHLDESENQTKKIMKMQAERAIEGLSCDYNEDIKSALMYLKSYNVKIPFAGMIAEVFPTAIIKQRRNFERFLDFIKAITIFYQFQRNIEGDTLIAEWEDYDRARDIFMNIEKGLSTIPLNTKQKQIINVLRKNEDGLALSEIHGKMEKYISLQNMRPHLESLCNLRVLDKFYGKDSLSREIIKYKLSEEYINFKPIKLPLSQELNEKIDSNNGIYNISNNNNNGGSEISQHAGKKGGVTTYHRY